MSWFGNKGKTHGHAINQSLIVDLCGVDLLNEGHLLGTVQPRDGSLQVRCESLVYSSCYPKRGVPSLTTYKEMTRGVVSMVHLGEMSSVRGNYKLHTTIYYFMEGQGSWSL